MQVKSHSKSLLIFSSLIIGFFSTIIVLAAFEVILRWSNFEYSTIPMQVYQPFSSTIIDDMNQRSGNEIFQKDNELFWRLKKGGAVGIQKVNQDGFFGERLPQVPPQGVISIACMGDSCTALGLFPYPSRLGNDLKLALGPEKIFVLNAGVPGYSSLQGVRSFRSLIKKFQINIATFYFNWNDHWKAISKPDKEFSHSSQEIVSMQNIFRKLRFYQFFLYLFKKEHIIHKLADSSNKRRVSVADFALNLQKMAKLAHKRGINPIFITAPIKKVNLLYEKDELPTNKDNYLIHGADEEVIHRSYNKIIRKIAKETKSNLLDLEKIFDVSKTKFLLMDDGIHLAPAGAQLASDSIIKLLMEKAIINPKSLLFARTRRTFTSIRPNIMLAKIELHPNKLTAKANSLLPLTVTISNIGDTIWNINSLVDFGYVKLGVRLYNANHELLKRDYARFSLPQNCYPNEKLTLNCKLKIPKNKGKFIMEFDPVNEGIAWFKKWGSKPGRLFIKVY